MSNMSYCRFENTYNDLVDCKDSLYENGIEYLEKNTNQHEKKYIKKLIQLCKEISEDYGELEEA